MNKQSYILVTTISASLLLWFFLIFSPSTIEMKSLNNDILESEIQLNDFAQTIELLPQFITERRLLKKRKDFINSNLYSKEEVINLFSRLKTDASIYNLEVTEITPPIAELLRLNSFIPDSTKPQFLNIGVQVSGSYIEFAKFIKRIEKESYFRGLNNCRISGSKEYNQELDLYLGFKALLGRIGDKS